MSFLDEENLHQMLSLWCLHAGFLRCPKEGNKLLLVINEHHDQQQILAAVMAQCLPRKHGGPGVSPHIILKNV